MWMYVLSAMLFCHIVDDYYLQGWLAQGKQRSWWEKNAPQEMYKNDYKMALAMHSFSWAFMIMFPLLFMVLREHEIGVLAGNSYLYLLTANAAIHYIVDDLKANKLKINLIQDQTIHIIQVIVTFFIFALHTT